MTPNITIAALVVALFILLGCVLALKAALSDARRLGQHWRRDALRNWDYAQRWRDRALVAEMRLAPFIADRPRDPVTKRFLSTKKVAA